MNNRLRLRLTVATLLATVNKRCAMHTRQSFAAASVRLTASKFDGQVLALGQLVDMLQRLPFASDRLIE